MDDDLAAVAAQHSRDPYLLLDDSVRAVVSRREWLWLPDSQKASLEADLCDPDPES